MVRAPAIGVNARLLQAHPSAPGIAERLTTSVERRVSLPPGSAVPGSTGVVYRLVHSHGVCLSSLKRLLHSEFWYLGRTRFVLEQ